MSTSGTTLALNACVVELHASRVLRDGAVDRLTDRERDLLAYLSARPGVDVSKDELLAQVWGYAARVVTRAVDATALRLRAKIERDPSEPDHLITAWGHGYRFEPSRTAPPPRVAIADVDLFVGREREQADLLALLRGGARLVTITGTAGIGKTRLAHRIAGRVDGKVWVCLAESAADAESLCRSVAAAIGADRADADLGAALAELGAGILVVDNLEQVADAAAACIGRWLAAAPELQVLATSRVQLDIRGERVVRLDPLGPVDALALLGDRVQHGVAIDAALGARIVERLDRLPLAIELAAGLTTLLSPEAVLERLEHPLDSLVIPRRDAPERHASLRAALEGSWALLDDAHRHALVACAVFRGPFATAQAEVVVGPDALARLLHLRACSLLVRDPDGRLRLLYTVRSFVEQQAWPGRAGAAERHRRLVRDEVRARVDPGRPADVATLAWLTGYVEDVHDAFTASLPVSPGDAAALALALHQVYAWGGPRARARQVLDQALGVVGPEHAADRAGLLRARAHLHMLGGDGDAAASDAAAAHDLAVAIGDHALRGRALVLLASLSLHRNQHDDAVARCRQALEVLEAAGDVAYAASAWGNLGTAYFEGGGHADARVAYARALALHSDVGNARSAALAQANLGFLEADAGRFDEARRHLSAALVAHRAARDRVEEARCMAHLGNLALAEDDPEEAVAWLASADAAIDGSGYSDLRGRISARLAVAFALVGDVARAHEAVARAREARSSADPADVAMLGALIHLCAHAANEARAALALLPEDGLPPSVAMMRPIATAAAETLRGEPGGRSRLDAALAAARRAPWAPWIHEARPWLIHFADHHRWPDPRRAPPAPAGAD